MPSALPSLSVAVCTARNSASETPRSRLPSLCLSAGFLSPPTLVCMGTLVFFLYLALLSALIGPLTESVRQLPTKSPTNGTSLNYVSARDESACSHDVQKLKQSFISN